MNARGTPAGICIIDLPDGSTQMLFKYEHVVIPDRDCPGSGRRSWKLVPLGCCPKVTHWFSKDAYRRAAAAESSLWAALGVSDDSIPGGP